MRQSSTRTNVIMKGDYCNSWNSLGLELQTSRKTRHEQPIVLEDVLCIAHRAVWNGIGCEMAVNVRHRTCTKLAHSFKAQNSFKY
jgi:hypothetical protein